MSAPVRARPAVGPDLAMCPRALLRTCEELGHDDAPAGLLLATGQLSAALHRAPDHVRDRVGRDGSLTGSVQPGGLLRAAAEGDVLTGEWAAVPGAADADWFVLAAERAADGQPVLVVLPAGRADRSAAPAVGSTRQAPGTSRFRASPWTATTSCRRSARTRTGRKRRCLLRRCCGVRSPASRSAWHAGRCTNSSRPRGNDPGSARSRA
ncbi:hypothetical protein ACFSVJ_04145 [Prauserella oleivorans]